MATKTTMKKERTMRDNLGRDIPVKYVSRYDRARDARARRILARWLKARAMIEQIVAESLADIEAVQLARDAAPNARGNLQFQSFDGLIQIALDQAWILRLDDRVIAARDAMLAYARGLCAKAGSDAQALYEIVEEAFAASRSGGLSLGRVLSICRRDIRAPEWLRARQMLLDAIQTDRGKAYIRVSTRPDTQRDFRLIRLDAADCWPIAEEVPHVN